ncbi:NAD(P)H-dependent glycerol-3-phosphate dehydrogenase [Marinovum algicola]|uniref:NAD(P)H-dependent glycerol-3-phosphate dehydrogenase n=1 Tax=Marinovum algicola TaxID=42444 RepID=UPI0024B9D8AD|nr:NAD(P)H-dependent glycerol-3-phosphate dehydrogenase [Marinovum algicola]
MSIGVIGAGAFGTSLAISLAAAGRDVVLWGRDAAAMAEMQSARENARRLPGAGFPERLAATGDFAEATAPDTVLLSVPMQQLETLLTDNAGTLARKTLVACCKGFSLRTGEGPVSLISRILPQAQAAILTGPSFAADIARGLPTALTLACGDKECGRRLQEQLSTRNLRLYRTTDVTGAELGGGLKNVIAIASGVVIGAGLGESARAALMTRGFAEMTRIAQALGARPETLAGLSGFGDLTLTCTSTQSRNYRFGQALGRNEEFAAGTTVEGAATARAMLGVAERHGAEMPITRAVTAIIAGELDVGAAMDQLLARPLKEE